MIPSYTVAGHTLALLRNGEQYFPQLVSAIDAAKKSIYLETYIYADDASGRLLNAALQRAAKRGVAVHVMLDGFGSADLRPQWTDEMRAAGVEVLWYRREVRFLSFKRYHLRRLHRKLAVIDRRTAFVGGINITDDIPKGIALPRLDYAVQVEGRVVREIHASMQRLWLLVSWSQFHHHGLRERIRQLPREGRHQQVAYVVRDNFRHRRDIERVYLDAIQAARHEILIANAYFVPGRKFRRALLEAAQRGVKVLLLLQGRVEYRLQHYTTQALYDEMLHAGIEIHEYQASFLHAKVAVVDSNWATVGSSNIDPFSLWLAQEANLVVKDAGFAGALRNELLNEMQKNAHRVESSAWRDMNLFGWVLVRVSYFLARMIAGMLMIGRERDEL